jgi:hypothetical protein
MPIPALNTDGFLPEGVHDCTLAEIRERFGQFQTSDVRCRLFERLEAFVRQAKVTSLVVAVIVDGSFVTAKDSPNDVDVIVVLRADHDYSASLRPFEYNVVVRPQIRRFSRIDAIVCRMLNEELDEHMQFFAQVRERDDISKGMLRIWL